MHTADCAHVHVERQNTCLLISCKVEELTSLLRCVGLFELSKQNLPNQIQLLYTGITGTHKI